MKRGDKPGTSALRLHGTLQRSLDIRGRHERVGVSPELAVADSVVLAPGAHVKAFLDSDPLNAVPAKLVRIDYQAHLSEANVAAYRIVAEINGVEPTANRPAAPQLGVRGTAQVYGPTAPLALYLFRRPLSALRQWTGL